MDFSLKSLPGFAWGVVLLLASSQLAAQTERHTIVVLDLGMPAEALTQASDITRALAAQAPTDHRLALVGADEIVHHLIGPSSGAAFAVEFEAIASDFSRAEFSSYSSGLERAVALGHETGAPSTLLVFTTGKISPSDPTRTERYQQWAQSIIMPDAASAGMRLLFASPTPLPDSLVAALSQASETNQHVNMSEIGTESLAQLLFAPAADTAADTSTAVLADNSSTANQQATAEQENAARLAAEQQAAEQARAKQLADQQAAEQAAAQARVAQLAEQQAAEARAEAAEQQAAEQARAEAAEQQAAAEPATSTQPTISITAVPVESESSGLTWMAIAAAMLAVLAGLGGWLFTRRRNGGGPSSHAQSEAERQAAYSDIRKEGETTLVKSGPADDTTPTPQPAAWSENITAHDAATMVNPPTAATTAPEADYDDMATHINTESHAFREELPGSETQQAAGGPASESANEPATLDAVASIEDKPAPDPVFNPADEFDVFEKSISAKRTGNENTEKRKSGSLAALTRDRTFDPALDTDTRES